MLSRAQKEEKVAALQGKFGRATGIFVADYRGLDVPAVNDLRQQLYQNGEGQYEYQVVKNSVLRRASCEGGAEALTDLFQGPTAVAISYGDSAALAKILVDYAKANNVFELKGGLLDGKPVDPTEIATIAALPGLDQLRGTLIGLLQAPATKLARLLKEPGGQLARLVDARRDALEGGNG